ncbi:MAG: FAD-dependent oxidoreductase [Stackebrandtia sp.]
MTATVTVVGGGYGGITAAQALDNIADVVLIDPKDSFVHNVASLRAVVDPAWADRMFFPYDGLLKRGRVIRDWAVAVESTKVWLSSGEQIATDYVVLATGTTYPFPAKSRNYRAASAVTQLHETHEALAKADSVLLLGAGPVGLELAGEIKAAWPHKTVTILDPARDILSGSFIAGFPAETANRLRVELRRQLHGLGVTVLTRDSLRQSLTTMDGRLGAFTAPTWQGRTITADIWFRCYGRRPATRSLSGDLSYAPREDMLIQVTPHLRIPPQRNVFAIGDITATAAPDTAVVAIEQGELVAENIRNLINGVPELKSFTPSQPYFLVPLGPTGGAAYSPDAGILDAATTSQYKGADLLISKYEEIFGQT